MRVDDNGELVGEIDLTYPTLKGEFYDRQSVIKAATKQAMDECESWRFENAVWVKGQAPPEFIAEFAARLAFDAALLLEKRKSPEAVP